MLAALLLVSASCPASAINHQGLNAITIGAGVLFKALLSALIYLWARDNSTSKVTLFGLVNVPARGGLKDRLVLTRSVSSGLDCPRRGSDFLDPRSDTFHHRSYCRACLVSRGCESRS